MRMNKQILIGTFLVTLGCLAVSELWAQSDREMAAAREQMVVRELEQAGIRNPNVLQAMRSTPRHKFVPAKLRDQAYLERALAIGHGQTISSPFVVASMTEALNPQPTDRVLEIGTGSGYQAAVLSVLVDRVYTIEIVKPLAKQAEKLLKKLKYKNVYVRAGDGYQGWPEAAPFDKIIVTCSPESPPPKLVEQLKDGGLMVIPLGERYAQNLCVLRKKGDKLENQPIRPILFVPMTGQAEEHRQVLPDPTNPELLNGSFEEVMYAQENLKSNLPPDKVRGTAVPKKKASSAKKPAEEDAEETDDAEADEAAEESAPETDVEEADETKETEAAEKTGKTKTHAKKAASKTKKSAADDEEEKLAESDSENRLPDVNRTLVPKIWCYLRQAQIVDNADAPDGKYCVQFSNNTLGQGSDICQGFGVDGRKISQLQFQMTIKGEAIYPDIKGKGLAGVYVVFVDEKRNLIKSSIVGGWRGSFDWKTVNATIDVPESAREALAYFGLNGSRGTLWMDSVKMVGVQKKGKKQGR